MTIVSKEKVDLDLVLIELKFVLKGFKQEVSIYTKASEACDFVDFMNDNRCRQLSKAEREMFDNRFYTFQDYKRKNTVTISLNDIKTMVIPYVVDKGDHIDYKILTHTK